MTLNQRFPLAETAIHRQARRISEGCPRGADARPRRAGLTPRSAHAA
jgi:hypothetical protein